MKIYKIFVLFLFISSFSLSAQSSQKIILNKLFDKLIEANDSNDAEKLEKKIWSVWSKHPKDNKTLLRRLHVEEGGKIFGGAKAFLLVWKKIPKYKFLYNFFKLPIIFTLFSFFYEIVAFFLYLKNRKQLSK